MAEGGMRTAPMASERRVTMARVKLRVRRMRVKRLVLRVFVEAEWGAAEGAFSLPGAERTRGVLGLPG
jgi:hypothetical protein